MKCVINYIKMRKVLICSIYLLLLSTKSVVTKYVNNWPVEVNPEYQYHERSVPVHRRSLDDFGSSISIGGYKGSIGLGGFDANIPHGKSEDLVHRIAHGVSGMFGGVISSRGSEESDGGIVNGGSVGFVDKASGASSAFSSSKASEVSNTYRSSKTNEESDLFSSSKASAGSKGFGKSINSGGSKALKRILSSGLSEGYGGIFASGRSLETDNRKTALHGSLQKEVLFRSNIGGLGFQSVAEKGNVGLQNMAGAGSLVYESRIPTIIGSSHPSNIHSTTKTLENDINKSSGKKFVEASSPNNMANVGLQSLPEGGIVSLNSVAKAGNSVYEKGSSALIRNVQSKIENIAEDFKNSMKSSINEAAIAKNIGTLTGSDGLSKENKEIKIAQTTHQSQIFGDKIQSIILKEAVGNEYNKASVRSGSEKFGGNMADVVSGGKLKEVLSPSSTGNVGLQSLNGGGIVSLTSVAKAENSAIEKGSSELFRSEQRKIKNIDEDLKNSMKSSTNKAVIAKNMADVVSGGELKEVLSPSSIGNVGLQSLTGEGIVLLNSVAKTGNSALFRSGQSKIENIDEDFKKSMKSSTNNAVIATNMADVVSGELKEVLSPISIGNIGLQSFRRGGIFSLNKLAKAGNVAYERGSSSLFRNSNIENMAEGLQNSMKSTLMGGALVGNAGILTGSGGILSEGFSKGILGGNFPGHKISHQVEGNVESQGKMVNRGTSMISHYAAIDSGGSGTLLGEGSGKLKVDSAMIASPIEHNGLVLKGEIKSNATLSSGINPTNLQLIESNLKTDAKLTVESTKNSAIKTKKVN